MNRVGFLLAFFLAAFAANAQERVQEGLIALYDFKSESGNVVEDRSGAGDPLNLKIADQKAVRRTAGTLEIHEPTIIQSDGPATKIIESIRGSGQLTIEAWVKPAIANQGGPARIVTLSKHSTERNFTLGQDEGRADARLRSSRTDPNGLPSLNVGELRDQLTHLVYTRETGGRGRLYVNGKQVGERNVEGDFGNWNDGFKLGLANEFTRDRPWEGTYFLVAIYARELEPDEVALHFKLGAGAKQKPGQLLAKPEPAASPKNRADSLEALYDFNGDGDVVRDVSGAGEPINLKIENMGGVRREPGSLEIRGETKIRSERPATRLASALRNSNEVTIEAWVKPATLKQEGPARIVTLSQDANGRNFTMGQENDQLDVRFRTTKTNTQGQPSLASPRQSLTTELTHIVYARARSGQTRIYLNGKQSANGSSGGDLGNWDESFHLALGNEMSGSRLWKGVYHHVAIYSRSLSAEEVSLHFEAGPGAQTEELLAERRAAANAKLFETRIAPLLADNCLECHDSANRKGKLDLSLKDSAFAKAIKPGNSAGSPLWESVEHDEMPEERDPLTDEEKQLLREWIDGGATWTLAQIDPAVYERGGHGGDIWVQRLTVGEYIETVRAAVGVDIGKEARHLLPPDLRADGFSNTAYNLTVDLKHVDAYAQLARLIVSKMDVDGFSKPFRPTRGDNDDRTRGFVSNLGKWMLRGPLNRDEIDIFSGIETAVNSTGGDFEESASYILEAMLQAPRFIYRIENQYSSPSPHELASRLSYIIWGGPPDQQLLDAADQGRLDIESQTRRMLGDKRAVERSLQFASEWLNLSRLQNLTPNTKKFPNWNADLADDMRDETLAYFQHVVWDQKQPMADLLNAQTVFATPRLAEHYGLKVGKGDGLVQQDVAGVPGRGGLLTQGSVLTIGGDEASMVARGLFVLHDLLRGVVKDPPPCVDVTPIPTKEGRTQRLMAEARIADKSCGGCHSKFEPLAFGLEKFNGIGVWRETDEHGNALREDGEILLPGTGEPIAYRTSAELMDLLAGSDRVRESIVWKLAQFSLGRPLGAADASEVTRVHQDAQKSGGTYSDIVTALVLSDLVVETKIAVERD
ncbi:MAG: hypothetical protein ACI8UO_000029 [Verrucomicrobiales bacterium]|jgi:hypothetical protein